ncbi:MAG: hypothetical protein KGQ40_15680, partial [Rhodospirillales bacterium]|nr:hypothetical protein [Rhodospirillales bacterium]
AAVAKRVSVAGWNPRDPGLRRHGFHHALVLDGLRHGDIAAALGALVAAVKPGGQFVLQELVAEEPGAALAAWCRLDGRAPPPRAGQIGDELARLGLDIRVSEDQSARHQGQICQGFAARLRELQGARLPAAYAAALVGEAERWLRRVRLMQAGGLRLMRWHALAPGR